LSRPPCRKWLPDPSPPRDAIEEKFLDDWKSWRISNGNEPGSRQAGRGRLPASGQPWLRLGLLAVEFKRYEEAKEYFRRRAKTRDGGRRLQQLGNLAFLRGNWESRWRTTTRPGEGPQDARIRLNMARVFLKQGHPQRRLRPTIRPWNSTRRCANFIQTFPRSPVTIHKIAGAQRCALHVHFSPVGVSGLRDIARSDAQ